MIPRVIKAMLRNHQRRNVKTMIITTKRIMTMNTTLTTRSKRKRQIRIQIMATKVINGVASKEENRMTVMKTVFIAGQTLKHPNRRTRTQVILLQSIARGKRNELILRVWTQ